MDQIEGTWLSLEETPYDIAIIKNNFGIYDGYDYIGIISNNKTVNHFNPGEIKIVMKKMDQEGLYSRFWVGTKGVDTFWSNKTVKYKYQVFSFF